METQDREKSPQGRPALIVLPLLILAGLMLVPSTRALFKAQVSLLFDSTPFSARLKDMGVNLGIKEMAIPPMQTGDGGRPAEIVAHSPNDYTLQVAGALLAGSNTPGARAFTPQEQYAGFQRRYGERLTALSLRFPDRPGAYAHLLRLMTMGTVRVSRDAEAEKYIIGKSRLSDRQVGCAESWEAFDAAAAQGEKRDPDNAYFPLMRGLELFDAKRDAEAIAAVLRAGQKPRFEDYSLEEPEASYVLYRRTYGVDSALLRESSYAATLLPHFAAIRALSRLTVAKAVQAEREGRPQEGLALRHALMQSAVRMREQGTAISALVGNAIFSIQTQHPGGVPSSPLPANATDAQKGDARRNAYLAYLRGIGQGQEADWVAKEDAANREVRELLQEAGKKRPPEMPSRPLPGVWTADMLLLANLLPLLLMCGAAVVLGRIRGGEKALPIVVLVVFVACMVVAFQMQWAESLTQMRIVLDNLGSFYDSNESQPQGFQINEIVTRYPGVVHVGEVLISLLLSVLTLLVAGAVSLFRKEPFPTALSRSLQRGALVFTTLLAATYAVSLITTARLEAQANSALDRKMHNEVAYLRQQNSR